jgi:hypothetical protein
VAKIRTHYRKAGTANITPPAFGPGGFVPIPVDPIHAHKVRSYHGNSKIGSGKNISEGPSYAPLLPHARALKFSHQEIGVEKEDNKTYLNHCSPDIFLHGKNTDSSH